MKTSRTSGRTSISTKPTWRPDVGPARSNEPTGGARAGDVTRILGIDPGSRVTGYAVLESRGTGIRVLSHGALRSPARGSFPSRLLKIADDLANVIELSAPDEAAVEDLFHAVNPKSALQLAHLRGAVLVELERRHVPLFAYAPLAVKKAITGAGRADKAQVRAMVERLLHVRLGNCPDDVSDALAVAICHAHTRRGARR